MPFHTPTNIEAVVQDVVLNSPLVQRKLLKHGKDAEQDHSSDEQERQRKKGLRKLLSGMVSSFRHVISGVMPSPTSAVVKVNSDNSIPLVDFVANRGLFIAKNTRSSGHNYAKLAISLESNSSGGQDSLQSSLTKKHLKKTNKKGVEEMVEMCEKSTETTPSLMDFDVNDDNFYLEEYQGYYDNDDSLSDYDEDEEEDEEDEFSCVVCERAFFTAKQLERHQYRKRHWGCRVCEERFPSLVLLEYHKEDEDHWSFDDEDCHHHDHMSINFQYSHKKRHRHQRCNFEAQREIMNELDDQQETEFGPNDEDLEMLVTSAKG